MGETSQAGGGPEWNHQTADSSGNPQFRGLVAALFEVGASCRAVCALEEREYKGRALRHIWSVAKKGRPRTGPGPERCPRPDVSLSLWFPKF